MVVLVETIDNLVASHHHGGTFFDAIPVGKIFGFYLRIVKVCRLENWSDDYKSSRCVFV